LAKFGKEINAERQIDTDPFYWTPLIGLFEMKKTILGVSILLFSLATWAETMLSPSGLDLSLPKGPSAAAPILVILDYHPDIPSSVLSYAKNILRRIDGQMVNGRFLNEFGNSQCIHGSFPYLIVLNGEGHVVGLEQRRDANRMPNFLYNHLIESIRKAGPFEPFPEQSYLGHRYAGIPSSFSVKCHHR